MESNGNQNQGIDCPSCDKKLMPRLDIKLRAVEEYDEFLKSRERIGKVVVFNPQEPYLTTARKCPHCFTPIQLQVEVIIKGAQLVESNVGTPQPTSHLAHQYYVNQLRENGVVRALEQALSVTNEGCMSYNVERRLFDFLEGATKLEAVPGFVVREFRREFPHLSLTFWQHHDVVGVKAGAEIKWFVPIYYIRGRNTKPVGTKGLRLRTHPRPEQIQQWIKTRNGYVVGHGAMFEELKSRRAGDFSKAAGNY